MPPPRPLADLQGSLVALTLQDKAGKVGVFGEFADAVADIVGVDSDGLAGAVGGRVADLLDGQGAVVETVIGKAGGQELVASLVWVAAQRAAQGAGVAEFGGGTGTVPAR